MVLHVHKCAENICDLGERSSLWLKCAAKPPDCPGSAQERPEAMTEIDIVSDQEQAERGGTAATDLQLESEQRAMQILYDYQKAAGATREAHGQKAPLPSMQIYSDLPREWPMARLAVSSKQINRLVRTFLWRRVTEQALHGSSFFDIPDEINQAYIGDLLLISEAFAAPLSNLFAFVRNGHPACPFIPQKQLALYANPRFWQYGLLAFIARCCSFDNQHRDQGAGAAQAREGKSQTTKEKDVDALTFMRTVIMSFVRGMEYGEQTLPTNDLFWGGPLWRPWNPLRFWRLVLGPSMDKIFARVVIRLAASHCS